MKVIVVFKRLLASGKHQHGRHLFKWGNRRNIIGFNFTKRDALSIVYIRYLWLRNIQKILLIKIWLLKVKRKRHPFLGFRSIIEPQM
jgi:hypothetical protein